MDTLYNLVCCCFSKRGKKVSKDNERQNETLIDENTTGELKMTGAPGEELATFGAGCYWGTEKYIVNVLGAKYPGAILGNSVGFMSPDTDAPEHPTYRQVCSKTTSHVEVLHFRFDNRVISYEELVRFFFTFHDPTTW